MFEKIKKSGNLPLIIGLVVILIIIIVLAIVLGININKIKETNNDYRVSESINEEEIIDNYDENEETVVIIDEVIDEEEVPEETEQKEEEKKPEQNNNIKYFIRVNYGQNVVNIYTKDENGEYTVPYKAMLCSTGTATPRSGTYTIPSGTYSRGTWGLMVGNVWAQYFTRIKGSILFHSVPYTQRNKWSLEYWEYDKLGTAASAGCVRLTVENARWIYNNCPSGTKVEFYTDSNPGPFGKPTEQKISDHEEVRGWDPKDPDENNPWKTYTPKQEVEQPEEEEITNTPATNPITPENPSASTTPSEPTTPAEPSTPTTPSEPTTPVTPSTPPTTPTEPTENETQNPTEDKDSDEEVKTPSESEDLEDDVEMPDNSGGSEEETETPNEGKGSDEEVKTPNEGGESGEQTLNSTEEELGEKKMTLT